MFDVFLHIDSRDTVIRVLRAVSTRADGRIEGRTLVCAADALAASDVRHDGALSTATHFD